MQKEHELGVAMVRILWNECLYPPKIHMLSL